MKTGKCGYDCASPGGRFYDGDDDDVDDLSASAAALPDPARTALNVPEHDAPDTSTINERSLTMKLLRYGPKGHEKPGLLDAQG